jgi:energy-coupling factor transporter ATP-binding protein EcfA2
MIFERLSVSGFRRFAQQFDFTPDQRFTVIHGPNGTGKSTLLDALYFGLLERHSVTGKDAEERFRSLGREITPTIEVDFAVDTVHYRLRKVFLGKAKSASLQRLESGRYIPLKDGSVADDFVRELFFAKASSRGAIDPAEHLGFAHVLWAPARATFGDLPTSAGDQIRAMFGGSSLAVTEGERVVQQRAATEHKRFFKDEGGYTARAGSADVPSLEARAAAAREAEQEAHRQYLRLEQLNVAYTDREAEAERMSSVRDELRAQITAAKSEVGSYNGLKTAAERAVRAEADAGSAYERVTTLILTLIASRTERNELGAKRTECANKLAELTAAAAPLHERFSKARTALENISATIAALQRRSRDLAEAQSYADSRISVERLQATLSSHDAAAKTLAELCAAQSAIAAPTRAELEILREAAAQVEALEATIAASALSLEIEALGEMTVDVVAGETTGPLRISAGTTARISAANDAVIVDIPSLGRIRAHGTDGAAKARKKLQPFADQLQAAHQRYGSSSIPEIAQRTERSAELNRDILQARTGMGAILEGRPIETVRELLAVASSTVSAMESSHPEWQIDCPDVPALRTAFSRDFQHATDAQALTQIDYNAAETAKTDIDAAIGKLKALGSQLDVRIEANAAQLRALEADGLEDDARYQTEQGLALSWNASKAEHAKLAQDLAIFVEDPEIALGRLEASERDAGASYERALGDAKTFRAQLDMQANLGSYAKLVAAEENSVHCESDLAAAKSQASAIACLSNAFERIQAKRLASVIGPVTSAASRFFTRIAGSPMGNIAIGEGLSPTGLIDVASGMKLLIDGTLSSGEKEQIYLATRLALAEVIAKDRGRQLFVVDDAATATDPNRLRRFVGLLEELSRDHLQVIVTTADPSRYLGIDGAKHVDLAAALLTEFAA